MNNEPVAWVDKLQTFVMHDDYLNLLPKLQQRMKPLYTHPAKTLDRELLDKTIIDQQNEIKELRKNLDVALMIVNEPAKTLTDEEIRKIAVECGAYVNEDTGSLYPDDMCVGSFAKAILKKASEK